MSSSEEHELIDAPPELERAPAPPPKIGEVDVLECTLGKRGTGKSTWQAWRAYELAASWGGAYVIGHSLGQRLPETLPPELAGRAVKLPIEYHATLAKLDTGLRRRPGNWHILAPPLVEERGRAHAPTADPETADDLLHYSMRLSFAIREQAWKREHFLGSWGNGKRTLGLKATPIIVIIDEGIAVEAASTGQRSRGDDRWYLQYLYSLRHSHIALLYAIQDPSARSWRTLEQATAIYCYNITHEWAINAVRACNRTAPIDSIPTLPKYQHVRVV